MELCSLGSKSPSPDPAQLGQDEATDTGDSRPPDQSAEVTSPARFSYSAPMDNLVVRSFQFCIM